MANRYKKGKRPLKTLRILPALLIAVFLLGTMLRLLTAVHATALTVYSSLAEADHIPANGIYDADPVTAVAN